MIATGRLLIREWRDADRPDFAAMCADPEIMRLLGSPQTRSESDAAIDGRIESQRRHGFCFWAVERRSDRALLGLCGLKVAPAGDIPIAGDIEVGWRLRRDAWGQGYAREAAAASLAWGFAELSLPRIVAITTPGNIRSWGLMERLGMTRRADLDFDHPEVKVGDPLRPHIVYVATAP